MARNCSRHLLFALFIVASLTVALFVNGSTTVQAAPTASDSIDIQVDHAVQIRNGGLVVINDTVKLSTQPGEDAEPLQNFLIGFPFIYRSNLTYVYAYDASNPQLDVEVDVGLGKIGFYGIEIGFSTPINVSNGEHYEFTVVFVFSNLISSRTLPFMPEPGKPVTTFNATFPAYPSLTQKASAVNLTIALPSTVKFLRSSLNEENVEFTNRTFGDFQIFNHTKSNVDAFTYEPFWLQFEGSEGVFLTIDVREIRRDVTVDSWKHVFISDFYQIIPKAGNLSEFKIQLLQDAFEVSAWDEFGNSIKKENIKVEQNSATLTFSPSLAQSELAMFKLTYQVPWETLINQNDWQNYHMVLSSFDDFNWVIRKLVVTLTLPEGAKFIPSPDLGVIQKSAFQETQTFIYYNITPFQKISQEAAYKYIIFWTSFRPTLWVGTAVAILGVLTLLWRAPRPVAPIPTILVKPEELKSYVDAYEEKRRSFSKLEMLEERTRKGKIPRRRYKVRKRALESRLSVLSKDLARLGEKLRIASPKYADMMRQIEIAEAELEGIEAGIRRTEIRYRRGEISTAAYHKLLEDYYRRRERARTTIDGVLIRLREEIA